MSETNVNIIKTHLYRFQNIIYIGGGRAKMEAQWFQYSATCQISRLHTHHWLKLNREGCWLRYQFSSRLLGGEKNGKNDLQPQKKGYEQFVPHGKQFGNHGVGAPCCRRTFLQCVLKLVVYLRFKKRLLKFVISTLKMSDLFFPITIFF